MLKFEFFDLWLLLQMLFIFIIYIVNFLVQDYLLQIGVHVNNQKPDNSIDFAAQLIYKLQLILQI